MRNNVFELELEKSAYCREACIEFDNYFGRGQLQIRGEYEEGATKSDFYSSRHAAVPPS